MASTARTTAVGVAALLVLAGPAEGQTGDQTARRIDGETASVSPSALQEPRQFSWVKFGGGFLASILAHEAAHLATAFVVGGDPSIGFDAARPVVYSGIDPEIHPARQFTFSASGMAVQLLINEVILQWPHAEGSVAGEFERGVLAGGVGTVVFYFTVGRESSVGDVDHMARASGLSKWWLTAIFGGVAVSDVVRMALDERYAHFFAFPSADGVHVGMTLAF